nr:hypothetical protein CFP56_22302 [Quercus suber]
MRSRRVLVNASEATCYGIGETYAIHDKKGAADEGLTAASDSFVGLEECRILSFMRQQGHTGVHHDSRYDQIRSPSVDCSKMR